MTRLDSGKPPNVKEVENMPEIITSVKYIDNKVTSTSSPASQADGKISWKVILAFIALEGQLWAYEMTLLIPGSMLSYVNADLGPSTSYVWISNTWPLCATVITCVAGRLSDIFGRRYFMLAGSLLGLPFHGCS